MTEELPQVLRLFIAQYHRQPMLEQPEALALKDKGLAGCIHGRPGSRRQILVMDMETLSALGLVAGAVKENITVEGLDLRALRQGQQLRVGQALLEVTLPCEPCGRMDEVRPGLQEELRGRRGTLCRVVESGRIRRGDSIEVVKQVEAAR